MEGGLAAYDPLLFTCVNMNLRATRSIVVVLETRVLGAI